jgi:hypothetical protein
MVRNGILMSSGPPKTPQEIQSLRGSCEFPKSKKQKTKTLHPPCAGYKLNLMSYNEHFIFFSVLLLFTWRVRISTNNKHCFKYK